MEWGCWSLGFDEAELPAASPSPRLGPRPLSMETEAAAARHWLLRWLLAPRRRQRRRVCSPGFRRRGMGICSGDPRRPRRRHRGLRPCSSGWRWVPFAVRGAWTPCPTPLRRRKHPHGRRPRLHRGRLRQGWLLILGRRPRYGAVRNSRDGPRASPGH
ncbi:hypothetical protein ACP70R_047569 [Stipagrostis hirtigluma subsp. patula]